MKGALFFCLLIVSACSREITFSQTESSLPRPVPPSGRMEPDGGSIGTSGGGDLRAFLSEALQEPARELYRANEYAAPGHFSDRGWELFRVARAEISDVIGKYADGFPASEFPPVSPSLYERAREDSLYAAELVLESVEEALARKFQNSDSAAREEVISVLYSIVARASAHGLVVPGV